MVSWSEGSHSSSSDSDISSPAPPSILCVEWTGLATDLSARCEHQAICEKYVAFQSVDSGRRFLGCAQKEGPKCGYVEWVDSEWPPQLKTTLGRLWDMYEDENKTRLSDNLANAEGIFKVLKEKEKMEKDLRFFKLDFAKTVADKEQALAQLGNTQIALSDLKEELEKKKISDKSVTNIHQVFRAKAEKELELIKQELELMNQERGKTMKERDEVMQEMDKVMQERDELKKEKKKLEYMIGDLFKHKEERKSKIRKVREILDEFE
uniref:Zinc finger GRF-type domain-containing protein n=1 Tax=Hordeum vulgare subsp. vulgare TaxID=112509 RepID=A0A8I6XJG1_HORVV